MNKTIEKEFNTSPQMTEVLKQIEMLYKTCRENNVSIMLIAGSSEYDQAIFGLHGCESTIIKSMVSTSAKNSAPRRVMECVFFDLLENKVKQVNAKLDGRNKRKINPRGN